MSVCAFEKLELKLMKMCKFTELEIKKMVTLSQSDDYGDLIYDSEDLKVYVFRWKINMVGVPEGSLVTVVVNIGGFEFTHEYEPYW